MTHPPSGACASPLLIMHIPKTAGTTFLPVVRKQYPADALWTLYPGYQEQLDELIHSPQRLELRAVMGHFRFGLHSDFQAGTKYVTLFREPVSRVISHYNHLINSDLPLHQELIANSKSLDDFLEHDLAYNLQTQYVTGWKRQEIEADPQGAVALAIRNLDERFLALGVVDRFVESLHVFCRICRWRLPIYKSRNLASKRKRVVRAEDLSNATMIRLRAAVGCDFELYNHANRWVDNHLAKHPKVHLKIRVFRIANAICGRFAKRT